MIGWTTHAAVQPAALPVSTLGRHASPVAAHDVGQLPDERRRLGRLVDLAGIAGNRADHLAQAGLVGAPVVGQAEGVEQRRRRIVEEILIPDLVDDLEHDRALLERAVASALLDAFVDAVDEDVEQAELVEHGLDRRDLLLGVGAGSVDDVEEQVGLARRVGRLLERFLAEEAEREAAAPGLSQFHQRVQNRLHRVLGLVDQDDGVTVVQDGFQRWPV